MEEKDFSVYIMTNKGNRVLYVGATSNLGKKVFEHQTKVVKGFTQRYNLNKLIYFESGGDAMGAFEREKQIKGWTRKKKFALIKSMNPEWKDLSEGLFS